MKRIKIIVVACLFTLGLLSTSCAGSKHACPAYGKANVEKVDVNA